MLLRWHRGWRMDGMTQLCTWRHCRLCPPRCPFQEQTLVAPWTSIWADSINVVVFKWNSFQLIATFFGRCSFLFFQFFVPAFRALTKHFQLSLLRATVNWGQWTQTAASSPPPATDWINNKPGRSTWTETCYLLLVRLYSTYNKDVSRFKFPSWQVSELGMDDRVQISAIKRDNLFFVRSWATSCCLQLFILLRLW